MFVQKKEDIDSSINWRVSLWLLVQTFYLGHYLDSKGTLTGMLALYVLPLNSTNMILQAILVFNAIWALHARQVINSFRCNYNNILRFLK